MPSNNHTNICIADYLELTEEQSRWFVERHGGRHL